MSLPVFTLYACDQVGTRQAQIDPYEKCEVVARANDVSTWQLDLPTDTPAGQVFATDTFARLEVAVDGVLWQSGPMTTLQREVDLEDDHLTVTGVDDTVWLARRLAHPQPAALVPPFSGTAYDVHTGQASTVLAELVNVNAGPGAIVDRQVAGLVVPTPTAVGGAVTVLARWQNLLALMQATAAGAGLVFDAEGLTFHVRQPANNGCVFSQGLETLAGWTLTAQAPDANQVYVAGGGTGTARSVVEVKNPASIVEWARAEQFQDRRDTTVTAELIQAGTDTLAQTVTPDTVVFLPLDTPAQRFGRDWQLGDVVTVVAGELTVIDQIREIHVLLDDQGVTITPSVGTAAGSLDVFRAVAGLTRRVRQLERI